MPATAAGLTAFMPPLSSFEVAQNPFEGVDHRLPPHAFPVAGEVPGLAAHRPRARPREANHSDRLLRCAAAGSRDAGHRNATVPLLCASAPCAISRAVASLTAPCFASVCSPTPSSSRFASLE